MADKIVIEAEVKSNIGDVSKDANNAAAEFKVMGVSLNSVKAGFASAAVTAKGMFSSIKAGLLSTGIGVFLVAIGALTQYFRDSEEGASKFKQITSQLGVVIGNVTDIVSNLGKSLFKLITGDIKGFKDGLAEVTQGVKDFGKTTRKEMAQANQLEKDRLKLQKFEREAIVEKARTEKNMMELRLKARDEENFATEERLAFMREANKLAAEQLEKDLHVAKEKLRFQQEENSFSKSTQENLDAEAQLQAQVFQIERSNFSERKRLKSEEQALVKQMAAQEKAILKEIADAEKARSDAKIKALEDEKKAADKLYDAQISQADAFEARAIAADEAVTKSKQEMASAVGNAIGALGGLMEQGSAAAKAAALTQIAIDTGVGFVQGLNIAQKSAAAAGPGAAFAFPLFYATQIAAVLSAAGQAKQILGAGGGVTPPSTTSPSVQTPAPQMMSGAFELSGGTEPEAMRAYVVTDEMTSSQNQLANIRRRATI